MPRARTSRMSKATPEKSTAVTCCPRPARNTAFLPVPQAMSSAGPDGRSGNSSRTMPAGSEDVTSAASLCLASHAAWFEGIKKAPELTAQEPAEKFESAPGAALLGINAEGAAAAAGALHIGIIELESGAFNRLDIID